MKKLIWKLFGKQEYALFWANIDLRKEQIWSKHKEKISKLKEFASWVSAAIFAFIIIIVIQIVVNYFLPLPK